MSTDQMIDTEELITNISQILNIEKDGEWHISSYDPDNDLYCVHADKMDLDKYKDLRGIVVSIKYNKVIARSHGFSPLVISNHIDIDDEGTISLTDIKKVEYKIKKENFSLKYCLEGTQIRVMRFGGKTYFMTHRQLDFKKSRWIVTRTFKELYDSLKGPKEEELFDLTKPYSPYCYYFLIHHPEVLNVCRDDVLDGTLVYIGKNSYWNAEDLGINSDEISNYEWNCLGTNNIIAAKTTRTIYDSRESIPVDKARNYLNYGFLHPFDTSKIDERIRPGESILVRETDDDGNFVRLIKVQSEGYYWRAMIKGDNPNLFNQFFKLATNALNGTYGVVYKKGVKIDNHLNYLKFRKIFPKLDKRNPEEINVVIGQKKLRVWKNDSGDEDYIWTVKDRLYNIWAAFLMVVPIHRQAEVATYLERFERETNLNVSWLLKIEERKMENHPELEKFHSGVVRIIETARKDATNSVLKKNLPEDFNGFEKMINYTEIFKKRIIKLMSRERGASRYKIMLNRRLLTANNEAERAEVQKEIDSFTYVEADFPLLPSKKKEILNDSSELIMKIDDESDDSGETESMTAESTFVSEDIVYNAE